MKFRLLSKRTACLAGAAALVLTAAACSSTSSSPSSPGSTASSSATTSSAPVTAGGSITVLESSGYAGAWTTLDPAENKEGAATQDFMTAIYGQLFELGSGGKIIPDLATGYTYSPNAETVTITLRQGVKFSDGTPFNAQAVAYNWNRDLGPIAIKNGLNPPWLVAEQKAPKGSPPGTAEPPLPGDIQVTGPYRRWHHLHEFQDASGGTLIVDRVDYEMPLGPFGHLAHWLSVRRSLKNH